MTACCCRLTHPAKTRTRKASGGGSESIAPSVRREVDAVQGAANLDSCAIKVGRLPSRQASHSCLEHADYRAIQPGPSFRTGRGRARRREVAAFPVALVLLGATGISIAV